MAKRSSKKEKEKEKIYIVLKRKKTLRKLE